MNLKIKFLVIFYERTFYDIINTFMQILSKFASMIILYKLKAIILYILYTRTKDERLSFKTFSTLEMFISVSTQLFLFAVNAIMKLCKNKV